MYTRNYVIKFQWYQKLIISLIIQAKFCPVSVGRKTKDQFRNTSNCMFLIFLKYILKYYYNIH